MRTITRALAGGPAILVAFTSATAGPAGGILVGDLTLDAIYLTRDLDADGVTDGPGETTIFFDGTNLSGLPAPTSSVFTIHQTPDGNVYCGDGGADAVYRLRDQNGDGDALDVGEAVVWFSQAGNFAGFGLPTPNGVARGPDGAIYIANAGTGSIPSDAIYRTVDLNHDGDAEDAGEATVWMDIQTLFTTAAPFELVFAGPVAYYTDTTAAGSNGIIRAEDLDASGSIGAGEFGVYIAEAGPLGVGIGTGLVADGASVLVSESSSAATQTVYRLTDLNASGTIDLAAEAVEVWTEALVPVGYSLASSFGLAIGPGGELAMGSAGADPADNVFRLVDGDADGDFLDAGETTVWAYESSGPGSFIENPRALEYIRVPCPGDIDGSGDVGFGDILAVIGDWGPCPGCPADLDTSGDVGFGDILAIIGQWGPCP